MTDMINYYKKIPKKFLNNVPNPQYKQHLIKTPMRLICSAPSGSGKSTLASHLLTNISSLSFSVSSTTRAMRKNEVHGVNYYFISNDEFKKNIDDQNFVEWEQVYNNDYKGTLKSEIDRLVSNGKNIIFDVDVVGGLNLKKYFGKNSLSIFVDVPSFKDLEKRLKKRGTDLKENIEERLQKAKLETVEKEKFDVIIMNDNIEKSKIEILDIVNKFLKE